jgi:hypothetical protein
MRGLIRYGLMVGVLAGCKSQPSQPAESRAQAGTTATAPSPRAFGAPIRSADASSLANLLEQPDRYAGKTVVVEGHVRRACSRKGCWMELAAAPEATAPGCRVTFKDYGFFVPTDSAGSRARIEAAVELARLEPSHVEHLEREGAKFAGKDADGSAREVRLVATGVELWRVN